ncbi:hypothetical protein E3N84_00295, partial [Terrimesophilobacter mesophilus]
MIMNELPMSSMSTHPLSRRTMLQGAGVGASALLLAACSSAPSAAPTAAVDRSEKQKSLRFDSRDT